MASRSILPLPLCLVVFLVLLVQAFLLLFVLVFQLCIYSLWFGYVWRAGLLSELGAVWAVPDIFLCVFFCRDNTECDGKREIEVIHLQGVNKPCFSKIDF